MSLFTGSILVVVLCQTIARQLSFAHSTSTVNLLLGVALLICSAAILTLWLEAQPRPKPLEESMQPTKKPKKKNRSDTAP
jgi:hypothetical protein